jgi:hypothetical protein
MIVSPGQMPVAEQGRSRRKVLQLSKEGAVSHVYTFMNNQSL